MNTKTKRIIQCIDDFCTKVRSWILHFLHRYSYVFALVAITFLAIIIRFNFLDFVSNDYRSFLTHWFAFLKNNGNFWAIDAVATDYPPLYITLLSFLSYSNIKDLYLIKYMSIFFDFVLAIGTFLVVLKTTKSNFYAFMGYSLTLFLPIFIFNSSAWGQCDAMYVGFIVWSIYFLIAKKPRLSMVMVGLALAVKIQTIFILPLFVFVWLKNKFSFRYFIYGFATLIITFIPYYIAGGDFIKPFLTYKNLTTQYMDANLNSGSIYSFFGADSLKPFIHDFGIYITLAGAGIALFVMWKKDVKCTAKNCIYVGTFFSLWLPFIMPHMHERYFFMAETMIILYCLVFKKRYYTIILMQVGTLIPYSAYLFGINVISAWGGDNLKLSTLCYMIVIYTLIKDFATLEKDSPKELLPLEEEIVL